MEAWRATTRTGLVGIDERPPRQPGSRAPVQAVQPMTGGMAPTTAPAHVFRIDSRFIGVYTHLQIRDAKISHQYWSRERLHNGCDKFQPTTLA